MIARSIVYRLFLLQLLLIGIGCAVNAQNKWRYYGQFNLGVDVNLTYGKGQRFPALRIYSAFSAMAVYREKLLLGYAPSLSVYTKTIGANLNPLVGDIQIDFTNSFSFGYGWSETLNYLKYSRSLHTGDFYNLAIDKKNAAMITSNFILNNHKRNQVNGSVTLSFSDITFNYYNDGAFPFNVIPVADNFDRYWTGGGGVFVHSSKGYNKGELTFDQFTGYTPLLYELSNILGINIPLYDESVKPYTFNTSAYQLKIFTDQNFGFNAGLLGGLVTRNGYHFGVQDLIHMAMRIPLHPNNDPTRFYLGGTYNNRQHVKL